MTHMVPHLEQYHALAFEPARLRQQLSEVRRMSMVNHVAQAQAGDGASDDAPLYRVVDGVARFDVVGPLAKYGSSLSPAPSMVRLRQALRDARRDDVVRAAIFAIDSPGGTVAGTDQLASELGRLSAAKPTVAFVDDMAASAAYWIASQASSVWATPSALVGSIGVLAVVDDVSKALEDQGVKVHVIHVGKHKAVGVEGKPVTDEDISEIRRELGSINDLFLSAIARGRGVSVDAASAWNTGQVWIASEAKEMGLIDEVGAYDEALASVVAQMPRGNRVARARRLVARNLNRTVLESM